MSGTHKASPEGDHADDRWQELLEAADDVLSDAERGDLVLSRDLASVQRLYDAVHAADDA